MPPFSLVVAATESGGIGLGGQLPWRLKGDMAFFKQLTVGGQCSGGGVAGEASAAIPSGRTNAVIMGRKTWLSIPPKFRPLPQRLNVVLSRQPDASNALNADGHPDVLIAQSLTEALARLNERTDVGTCFVIGGGQVYADALRSPDCHRIYMTRVRPAAAAVDADIPCDTFFPDLTNDTADFTLLDTAQTEQELSWAQPLRRVENGLEYEFQIYERRAADAVDKENEAASQ